MAELFVFSIAEQFLGKLTSSIFQEISSLWGLEGDLRSLENTVTYIQAVLLDAQDQQSSSHQLRDWIGKLEDALYHAEHILEELEIYALRSRKYGQNILGKVRREFSRSNKIVFRFKMAHKIKKVRKEFDEIAANRNKFNLRESSDERVVIYRETHSFLSAHDVIGRDKERDDVVAFLMFKSDYDSVPVFPIIGLGGMGKTMLAKMVYNDERVANQFDLRIWVCVSDEFKLENIIKDILKSTNFPGNCDNLSLEQLQQCLREMLKDQTYLLILDDVWNENRDKWIELKNLLEGGLSGSRIVVTTRSQLVAEKMATSDHHRIEIEGLSSEESLSLFLKLAFSPSQEANKFPPLKKIALEIVEKCKGVPLALRTLGGILYNKRDEREWRKVRDNEIWKIEQKENDILPALKLSYYQLPTNLRRCFAFCSIFPKDYRFNNLELTAFWKANGMIKNTGHNQNMEDVSMTYIKQLLSIGFFQEFGDYGSYVNFKMHDLVHDLALLVAQLECISSTSEGFQDCLSTKRVRHVAFPKDYFSENEIPDWLLEHKKNIRTVAFPYGVGAAKVSFVNECVSKFKSLHLLDLRGSSFEVLPSSICSLKHLKHLDLEGNCKLKSIPASICELVGLETLDFGGCSNIEKLPVGFGKLIRLRSLGISTKESYLPENEMKCLTSLQNLHILECPNLQFVMSNNTMKCLSGLRLLAIEKCGSLMALPFRGLSHLTAFEIFYISNCENLDIVIGENEDSGERTSSLRVDEHFQCLHTFMVLNLPQLEILPLWLLHGDNNLTYILISNCENLTNLVPEGMVESLKFLKKLGIVYCPKLESLPEGMHCLTTLEEVSIWRCPKLIEKCQRETGEDWHKISHVCNIYLDSKKI